MGRMPGSRLFIYLILRHNIEILQIIQDLLLVWNACVYYNKIMKVGLYRFGHFCKR